MMTDKDEGKMLFHPDCVRERIRTSQIIDRLRKCASGEISLTRNQLWAAEILLRKRVPDRDRRDALLLVKSLKGQLTRGRPPLD
jgi:hypothetical protein